MRAVWTAYPATNRWWSAAGTPHTHGEEAAAAVEEVLQKELPQYQFAGNYGAEQRSCYIQLGYTEDSSVMPQEYAELLPLDAPFDKSLLQKIPTKLSVTGVWPTTPTQADVDTVLAQVKQVMEANGYRFAWYNITLTDATAPTTRQAWNAWPSPATSPRRISLPLWLPRKPPGKRAVHSKALCPGQ